MKHTTRHGSLLLLVLSILASWVLQRHRLAIAWADRFTAVVCARW